MVLFVFFPLPQLKNKSILKEDLELRNKYQDTDNWPAHKGSDIERLVKKILLKPEIALYIKTLTLDYWQFQWEAESPDEDVDADFDIEEWLEEHRPARHVPYFAKDFALFNQALEEDDPLLRGGMDVQTLQDVLADGHQDPLVCMLITRLPNVRQIRWIDIPTASHVLKVVQTISESPTATSLRRLEYVDFQGTNCVYGEELSLIKPFAMLPSVRKIVCSDLIKEGGSAHMDDIDYYTPGQISRVTHLNFKHCDDKSKDLHILLEGFDALKSFTFTNPRTQLMGKPQCDLFWIRSALYGNLRHSLQSLTMRFPRETDKDKSSFMGGLRRFAVLKKLEFDYHLLVDPKAQADEAPIADLLPPSIEDIHFHGLDTSNMKTVRRLIGQLTDAKVDILPVLRKLSLVTQARSSEVVKKVVEAVVEEDSEDEDEEMSEGEAEEQSDGEEDGEIDEEEGSKEEEDDEEGAEDMEAEEEIGDPRTAALRGWCLETGIILTI